MNIVLDTNVLISAVLWRGQPYDAMKAVLCSHALVQSQETLAEFATVIARPKFNSILAKRGLSSQDAVEALFSQCEFFSISKRSIRIAGSVKIDDPDDRMFIALALEAKAKLIVSGDDHLLKLGNVLGIEILSISEFMRQQRKS